MALLTPNILKCIVKTYKKGYYVKDLAAIFNVNRWLLWKWRKRAYHPRKDSHKNLSTRPLKTYPKVTQEIENAIIVLRDSFN